MSKNINPDVKKLLTERIAYERKLNEKSKVIDVKRKTQAVVAGTLLATTLSSGISPAFADSRYENSDYKGVGYISVAEEVGPQGDGGFISSGKGDAGGVSYGLTQLSTVVGSADEFVDKYLKENYPEFYKFFENADKAGTDSFNEAWTNAYNHNPGEFERIQLENKEVNFVQPSYKNVKEKFGIDLLSTRARTEFLHSTSVQFGPGGIVELVEKSGVTKDMDDEELLSKLADEKYNSVGAYKFLKCSEEVRQSVRGRFKREKEEYIKIAKEEKGPLLEDEIDYTLMESESSEDEFVETAKSYLNQGTTYKMGGKNTKQLDCSGYVSLVYQDMGLDINEMMTNAGKFRNDSKKISRDEIKEGDLVFWHDKTGTKHASVFHIGIYIGDDTVVDCSPDHNGVGTRKLSSLKDNNNRYYTFGRYEKLQDKLNSNTSDTKSDIYLDLSETDEFESDIEISESVEEKFEDEDIKDTTETEETTEEDESIIDDEETTDEDESIVDEETTEETTEDDESIIDDEETTEEDESIIDDEETAEEDESIIDDEETTEDDESIIDDEETTEDDESIIDDEETTEDDESIIDDEETTEDDESIIDDEETTEDDESTIDEETTEEDESVEEETTEESTDKVEEATEETTEEDESTVEESTEEIEEATEETEATGEATDEAEETETVEETTDEAEETETVEETTEEAEVEESTDTEVEAEENTKAEESESKTEEAKPEVEAKEEVKEDKVDINKKVETEQETKTESTQESTEESTTEEVKTEKEETSSTDNNASTEESSPDVDTNSQIKEESTVLVSSSEARIQELEKKLENNLFANLFRG